MITGLEQLWAWWLANPLAQTIGLMATMGYVLATLQHDDRRLFITQIVGTALFIVHYALLGAWVAALGYVVGVCRNGAAIMGLVTPQRRIGMSLLFVAAYGAIALLHARSWIEVIPPFCGILTALAFFNFRGIAMRLVLLCAQGTFIIYALWVGSIGGLITASLEMIFTLLTLWRMTRTAASVPQGG